MIKFVSDLRQVRGTFSPGTLVGLDSSNNKTDHQDTPETENIVESGVKYNSPNPLQVFLKKIILKANQDKDLPT